MKLPILMCAEKLEEN